MHILKTNLFCELKVVINVKMEQHFGLIIASHGLVVKCLVGNLIHVVLQEQHAGAAVKAIIGIGVGLATIAVEDI